MKNRYDLDKLRSDRDAIAAVLEGAGAKLDGSGACRCPFHDDQRASAGIYERGGVWRFKCQACGVGGDVIELVERLGSTDFLGAVTALGIPPKTAGNGAPRDANGPPCTPTRPKAPEPAQTRFDAAAYARECAARLTADAAALDKLWRTRAVDSDTARRLGIGITADGRHWTFPVSADAVKHHRADPDGDGSKSFWLPKGASSRRLWPIHLDAPGAVWLCPGELKAAGVIAAGRAAVGITGGEGADLPDGLAELLAGRAVAIVADDDQTGRAWLAKALAALRTAGIDARAVDLGLDKAAGLKDIGDWILSRVQEGKEPAAIAAELDNAYELADPFRPFTLGGIWTARETWAPVYHVRTGLRDLDTGLGGGLRVGGVHLFVGKSGRAKSTTVAQIALNAARAGVPACIVSLEMPRRDMGHLIAANLADVPRAALASGNIRETVKDKLRGVLREYGKLPLTILDDSFWSGPLTRSKLAEIVADGCRRFGWRLICVDYLGLLANEPTDASDYAADLENSAALKRLARVQDVALVAVAALRKYGRANSDAPASLDDVLGAGRICYDAVNVFDVDCQQDSPRPGERPVGTVRLRVLKTRYAGLGSAGKPLEFRWFPSTGRIEDPNPQWGLPNE